MTPAALPAALKSSVFLWPLSWRPAWAGVPFSLPLHFHCPRRVPGPQMRTPRALSALPRTPPWGSPSVSVLSRRGLALCVRKGPPLPKRFQKNGRTAGWRRWCAIRSLPLAGRRAKNQGAGAGFALERFRPAALAGTQPHPVLEGRGCCRKPQGRRQVP